MSTFCNTCGEQNAPDAEFCSSCRSYLGWQDRAPRIQPSPEGEDAGSHDTLPIPETHEQAPRHPSGSSDERDPFHASAERTDVLLTLDGAAANIPVRVTNMSTLVDGYVVDVVTAPPWLEFTPGRAELLPSTTGTLVAQMRIASGGPVPAQKLALVLRVHNTTGRTTYYEMSVALTVPVVTAPIQLRAEPRLLRVRDTSPGVCRVIVSNSGTNRWAQVQLSAGDPEQVVRATWTSQLLQVPPGGEEATEVRFDAPAPAPGGELSRIITVTANEGPRSAETSVTLNQSASDPAMETLALRIDPSLLRLRGRHRGKMTALVDNRRGTTPLRLTLIGHDPEKILRFEFSPTTLVVEPGRESSVGVTVTAPRTPSGQEVIRPFAIAASDGLAEVRTEGRVIQQASSRRGLARILLTVIGGLLMVLGSLAQFISGNSNSGVDLTATEIAKEIDENSDFHISDHLNFGGVQDVVSIGLILIFLAVFVVFGLTGRSGRLTRISALLGFLVVLATCIALPALAGGSGPAAGALLAATGCVMGYVGGLLARR